jgi:hypothetical protein
MQSLAWRCGDAFRCPPPIIHSGDDAALNLFRILASYDQPVKSHPAVAIASVPLAIVALACSTSAPRVAPDPVAPPLEASAASAPPPAAPSPLGERCCTEVGCNSGVRFVVHLDEKVSALTRDGTIHVCSGASCADGKLSAPTYPRCARHLLHHLPQRAGARAV